MATPLQVKEYLACWLQLGRSVIIERTSGSTTLQPNTILGPRQFSPEFEAWWQTIQAQADQCHLEGTNETIAELLSDQWEVTACSRCQIPVTIPTRGMVTHSCPCSDLESWPNDETLPPRQSDSFTQRSRLEHIHDRLCHSHYD